MLEAGGEWFPTRDAEMLKWPYQSPRRGAATAQREFGEFDACDGGWEIEQSVKLARLLRAAGVDLIDCSSGSITPQSQGPMAPNFQVPLAQRIRREAGIATAAVGVITQAKQAEQILADGSADLIFLARALLLDPYWPLRAAEELEGAAAWPIQYRRAVNPRK